MAVRTSHPVFIGRMIASPRRHIYFETVALALVTTSCASFLFGKP